MDIGGEPFAHNPKYRNVRFDISKVAAACGFTGQAGQPVGVLGEGAACTADPSLGGHCAELMVNSRYGANNTAEANHNLYCRAIDDEGGRAEIGAYTSQLYGGLGNLHLTDGQAGGQVLRFRCSKRKNTDECGSLPQYIRRGLQQRFGGADCARKRVLGFGSVFKVTSGKVKAHTQPDYCHCAEGYYDAEKEEAVKPFLRFYDGAEAMGPQLVCLNTMWTEDPTGGALGLRASGEHTHFFSYNSETKTRHGGHYHGDVTPSDISYDGLLVPADAIVRVRDGMSEALADKKMAAVAAASDAEPARFPSVCVIGAGAMGCLFGGLLHEHGIQKAGERRLLDKIVLVDKWQEHIDSINNNGLKIVRASHIGEEETVLRGIQAVRSVEELPENSFDVVIIQCKATDTRQCAKAAKHILKKGSGVAVSFQNGLGNCDMIAEELDGGEAQVLGGQTLQGANIEAAGVVRIHTNLPTYLGEWAGGLSPRCQAICNIWSRSGLPMYQDGNMKKKVWMKAIYNCVVSPLSTVTNLTHREVYVRKDSLYIAEIIIKEALLVIGKELGPGFITDAEGRSCLDKVIASNQANKSSMCADILAKRKSEIDFINGWICHLADKHGVLDQIPMNRCMKFMVNGLESHYDEKTRLDVT